MKRILTSIFCLLSIAFISDAQKLKFTDDGEFKIVQFTDLHYKWGDKESDKAIECIASVLDDEQPDLVVFTGDQIYRTDSVEQCLKAIMRPVIEREIPFAAVFGNHDDEYGMSRHEMHEILQSLEGSLMPKRSENESLDYAVTIRANKSSYAKAAALYFIDSHAKTSIKGTGKYDWIKHDQINWYREQSNQFSTANGGKPLTSLMFFHIPLPEYATAMDNGDEFVGTKRENVCCPELNSGLFTSIKEIGDVKGVFCGHDHNNDFAVNHRGILLAYGRYSGGNTVYNNLGPNGARVILLKRDSDAIKTWIRLSNGKVIDSFTFDNKIKK